MPSRLEELTAAELEVRKLRGVLRGIQATVTTAVERPQPLRSDLVVIDVAAHEALRTTREPLPKLPAGVPEPSSTEGERDA